jgi:hypothetical protein
MDMYRAEMGGLLAGKRERGKGRRDVGEAGYGRD